MCSAWQRRATSLPSLPSPTTPSLRPLRLDAERPLPSAFTHPLMLVRDVASERQNESQGQLGSRMGEHAGAANEDAAIGRRLHIDRGVAHAGGDEELKLRQALEQRPWERRALAHGDEDLIILEPCRGGIDAAQRRIEHIDRDLGFQARPIRHGERDILIIVENGKPLHAIAPLSAAWTLTGHEYGFVYRQSSASGSGRASPASVGETMLSRRSARPGRGKK